MRPTIGALLCVDTAKSGAEWPFVRVNPAFAPGTDTEMFAHKRSQPVASNRKKKIPTWFQTAQMKKRHAQRFPAFDDTAETAAYSKHGV